MGSRQVLKISDLCVVNINGFVSPVLSYAGALEDYEDLRYSLKTKCVVFSLYVGQTFYFQPFDRTELPNVVREFLVLCQSE